MRPITARARAATRLGFRASLGIVSCAIGVLLLGHLPVLGTSTTCSVSLGSGLSFGVYDPLSVLPDDAVVTVSVSCNGGMSSLEFAIDGLGSDGNRRIYNGANYLTYNIYSDAARTQVIGSGSSGTNTFKRPNPGQSSLTYFYGRISAGQDVPAGLYSGTVVVTLNF